MLSHAQSHSQFPQQQSEMMTKRDYDDTEQREEDAVTFPFPFPPYPVQLDVMRCIRRAILQQRTIVIESPTGTGKSHMLLNGVLSTVFGSPSSSSSSPLEAGWPASRLIQCRQRPLPSLDAAAFHYNRNRRRVAAAAAAGRTQQTGDEADLLLSQSSESDGDADVGGSSRRRGSSSSSSGSSSSEDDDKRGGGKEDRYVTKPKVFFASRTHSQLSQLSEAFTQTVFGGAAAGNGSDAAVSRPSLCPVQLASRQQLCVNQAYRNASQGNPERLNERCREAVRYGKTKEGRRLRKLYLREQSSRDVGRQAGSGGVRDVEDLGHRAPTTNPPGPASSCMDFCPYSAPSKISLLVEHMRVSPKSQEELRALGTSLGACPFLASRELLREASVVFLPYSYLTDRKVRQATLADIAGWEAPIPQTAASETVSLSLPCRPDVDALDEGEYDFTGDVVVFDEAHNVADAARAAKSASFSEDQAARMLHALQLYMTKFDERLLSKNKAKIRGIMLMITKMANFMKRVREQLQQKGVGGEEQGGGDSHRAKRLRDDDCENNNRRIHEGDEKQQQSHSMTYGFSEFTFAAEVDTINVYPLCDFLQVSHLLQKLPSLFRTTKAIPNNSSPTLSNSTFPKNMRSRSTITTTTTSPEDDFLETRSAGWALETFLRNFADADSDCVVICRPASSSSNPQDSAAATATAANSLSGFYELKLLSLAPWRSLQPVSSRARSLIFAGGTMHPLALQIDPIVVPTHQTRTEGEETQQQHLHPLSSSPPPPSTYDAFSFGHVVPPTSLRVFTLGKGPSGNPIELTHRTRHQRTEMLRDVALTVLNLLRVIPDGVIVCFTSYRMEQEFISFCQQSGMLDQIEAVKRVFREPRNSGGGGGSGSQLQGKHENNANALQAILQDYTQYIMAGTRQQQQQQRQPEPAIAAGASSLRRSKGAMITCVMGGKLSEGINFNDALGRGVIVVGLPYASPDDEETHQLLSYAVASSSCSSSSLSAASSTSRGSSSSSSSSSPLRLTVHGLATDLCMRAVNQSIGRCIRHMDDYAVVVLLDQRYYRKEIASRISGWMHPSIVPCEDFGSCFRGVREFFANRK